MRPLTGIIEAVLPGMGEQTRTTASNARASLSRRIRPTPALETAIAEARLASDTLDLALDQRGSVSTRARAAAVNALEALIAHLAEAQPSEGARGLGLGW